MPGGEAQALRSALLAEPTNDAVRSETLGVGHRSTPLGQEDRTLLPVWSRKGKKR